MKVSFMQRLSLGIVVAVVLFAVMLTFTTGLVMAANNIALSYLPAGSVAPFPQPWYELLLSFAVAFIPVAIVVWDHQNGKQLGFIERLTLAILVGLILFGVMLTFMTGLTTATNGIALYYGAATPPFAQPFYELLVSFAVAMIPLANEIWKHNDWTARATEKEVPAPPTP